MLPSRQTLEREVKLKAERGFVLPRLPGTPIGSRVLTSIYYDSEALRLAEHGITLRYRIEGRHGLWQLKIPKEHSRLELEWSGPRTGPPPHIMKLLLAYSRGQPLKTVARLRTRRAGVRVPTRDGGAAEVVLDSVAALEGRRIVRRLYEVEVESRGAGEAELHRIVDVLRKAGAEDSDGRPKVFQLLGVPSVGPMPAPPPDAPPVNHLKAVLAAQVWQLLGHDPGTRLGRDPEDLHQMRVAVRRFGAVLRAARPMLSLEWADSLRRELSWLGDALGPARDLDVLMSRLRAESGALPVPEYQAMQRIIDSLEEERLEAHRMMRQALETDRYLTLLARLERAIVEPELTPCRVSLLDIARSEFRKLRRAMRALPSNPTAEWIHRIRIKGKRARYAAELAEGTGGKRLSRLVARLKQFQNLLGEHQDATVAEQRLRKSLGQTSEPLQAFALGRLIEREEDRQRSVREALPAAWTKVKKRGRAAWEGA